MPFHNKIGQVYYWLSNQALKYRPNYVKKTI